MRLWLRFRFLRWFRGVRVSAVIVRILLCVSYSDCSRGIFLKVFFGKFGSRLVERFNVVTLVGKSGGTVFRLR